MKLPKSIRLTLISFLIATILFLGMHLFVVSAQQANINNDTSGKLFASESLDGSPWGMIIYFAEGTTVTEANNLRLEYDLQLDDYTDERGYYRFLTDDNSEATKLAIVYYHGTGCTTKTTVDKPLCPPVTPISAHYSEPVSEEIEALLLADSRVAKLDNRNDRAFFLTTVTVNIMMGIPHIIFRIVDGYIGLVDKG